jgi:hypothetical protein
MSRTHKTVLMVTHLQYNVDILPSTLSFAVRSLQILDFDVSKRFRTRVRDTDKDIFIRVS